MGPLSILRQEEYPPEGACQPDGRSVTLPVGRNVSGTATGGSPLEGQTPGVALIAAGSTFRRSRTGTKPVQGLAARCKKLSRTRRDVHTEEEVRQDPIYRRFA